MHQWVLLEDTMDTINPLPGFLFENPIDEIVCWDTNELLNQLNLIDTLRRKGYYLVGFVSYEAGYVLRGLDPAVQAQSRPFPLLHFQVFTEIRRLSPQGVRQCLDGFVDSGADAFEIKNLMLTVDEARYTELFTEVMQAILAGDTYQVNLTAKYQFDFEGSVVALYNALRSCQQVAYSGLLAWSDYTILSLSPELFFSKQGQVLRAKPMKGTAARSNDPIRDAQLQHQLCYDPKSIAENTMIVDLLRNDLAMISRVGSVKVPQLLAIESYATLHQLVSCIESEVDEAIPFKTIIQALFPCGSITGAPKRRTMQIIQQFESMPRHVYTGAIGYVMPNNDMCFNVAIRTLLLKEGKGELGVGGGVVADSTALGEFDELRLKARYFTQTVGA